MPNFLLFGCEVSILHRGEGGSKFAIPCRNWWLPLTLREQLFTMWLTWVQSTINKSWSDNRRTQCHVSTSSASDELHQFIPPVPPVTFPFLHRWTRTPRSWVQRDTVRLGLICVVETSSTNHQPSPSPTSTHRQTDDQHMITRDQTQITFMNSTQRIEGLRADEEQWARATCRSATTRLSEFREIAAWIAVGI